MVCLGYFLTVSCEKHVDFFKKKLINICFKKIFDWSEFPIRLVFIIFKKNNQHFFLKKIFDWSESGIRILLFCR